MTDILVAGAFVMMVLTPCLVAMETGVVTGADLGVRDLSESKSAAFDSTHIPG